MMNEIKFDIKTVITFITAAIVFGGFYYTTQHRLDHLETKITDLEIEISKVKKRKIKK
jgi:uncharacterized membrane protein YciS (DUF1049 family)